MKIAHIIPYSISYPLSSHNGRYEWVAQLATLQAQAGHDVTIYGSPDSQLTAGIRTAGIQEAGDNKRQNNIDTFRLAFQNDHDIYHSHLDNLHYEVAHFTNKSIVFTQHWWPGEDTIRLAHTTESSNVWAVPPTRYMHGYDMESGIQSKGYLYHGIDLSRFQIKNTVEKNNRLLFVGRIAPEKNLHTAIAVSKLTGTGLDIVGKVPPQHQAYWESLLPEVDGTQITYHGAKNHEELVDYYSSALALLFPSDINEPFGLVAIEAQACGTPVIMRKGGSRGELIDEYTTGLLCLTDKEFALAVSRVATMRPSDCVQFANKFDVSTMARAYEGLYTNLVA